MLKSKRILHAKSVAGFAHVLSNKTDSEADEGEFSVLFTIGFIYRSDTGRKEETQIS